MDKRDLFAVLVLGAPGELFVHELDTVDPGWDDKVWAALKEAASLVEDLASEVKSLVVALGKWSDGCMGPIAGALAAGSTLIASTAVFIAGIPADATGIGAVIGVPAQLAAVAGIIASLTGLIASVVSVLECKDAQVQAAAEKVKQDAANKALKDELDGMKANIEEIKKHQANIKSDGDKLRGLTDQL